MTQQMRAQTVASVVTRRSTFRRADLDHFLFGSTGDDVLRVQAGAGPTLIDGRDGKDSMFGGDGNDMLLGREGDDVLHSGPGDDLADGGPGNDSIWGDSGNDLLAGAAGNDLMFGGFGDDVLDGGTGNDLLIGGNGDDTFVFRCGDGVDTIVSSINGRQWQKEGDDEVYFADVNVDKLRSVTLSDDGDRIRGRNLVVSYGVDDRLSVWTQVAVEGLSVGKFRFADGTTITPGALMQMYSGENGTLLRSPCSAGGRSRRAAALEGALANFRQNCMLDGGGSESHAGAQQLLAMPEANVTSLLPGSAAEPHRRVDAVLTLA